MPDCIAAVLAHVLKPLLALLSSSKGRHAARRRRSRRVRRYTRTLPAASRPAPQRTSPSARRPSRSPIPPLPRDTPILAPARRRVPAEEVALVRPYYLAHEQDLARVQHHAATRLQAWGAQSWAPVADTPGGHQEAPTPRDGAASVGFVPVRRAHAPAPRVPEKFEELTHLSRIRRRQQAVRAGTEVLA